MLGFSSLVSVYYISKTQPSAPLPTTGRFHFKGIVIGCLITFQRQPYVLAFNEMSFHYISLWIVEFRQKHNIDIDILTCKFLSPHWAEIAADSNMHWDTKSCVYVHDSILYNALCCIGTGLALMRVWSDEKVRLGKTHSYNSVPLFLVTGCEFRESNPSHLWLHKFNISISLVW